MATRRTFCCPQCRTLIELSSPMATLDYPICTNDGQKMVSYFGNFRGDDVLVNYGFRESRYHSEESANIAKFQFTNL